MPNGCGWHRIGSLSGYSGEVPQTFQGKQLLMQYIPDTLSSKLHSARTEPRHGSCCTGTWRFVNAVVGLSGWVAYLGSAPHESQVTPCPLKRKACRASAQIETKRKESLLSRSVILRVAVGLLPRCPIYQFDDLGRIQVRTVATLSLTCHTYRSVMGASLVHARFEPVPG